MRFHLTLIAALTLTASVAFAQSHEHGHDGHGHEEAHSHDDAHAGPGHAHGGEAHSHGEAGAHGDAHGEGHGSVTLENIFADTKFRGAVFNFGLLLIIFFVFGRKHITNFLTGRSREIEESLAEAARLKAEAEAKHAEYASRLSKLDSEIETIRADMVKAGEAERDRIVKDAEEKAERMRRDARFTIDQRLKQLREDLTKEASASAVAAAQELLQQKTTSVDQQRLADVYIERLKDVARQERAS